MNNNLMTFNMGSLGDYLAKNEEKINAVKVGPYLVDIKRNNLTFDLSNGTEIMLVAEPKSYINKFTLRIRHNGKTIANLVSVRATEIILMLKKYKLAESFVYIIRNCSQFPETIKNEFIK